MIRAEIIKDSIIAGTDCRLTTYLLTYPRFIHSEVMTHRAFSRNAASSRAIPIWKMIKGILLNPAYPVRWGCNGRGMQDHGVLPPWKAQIASVIWYITCLFSCGASYLLFKLGVHKQLANRVTEPWAHITTLVSATQFDNFFALRCHKDAQPEFQQLAYEMLQAYKESVPTPMKAGEWHIPFSSGYLFAGLTHEEQLKVATARCARTSYCNFDGKSVVADDIKMHDDLLANGHMSPFEHCAQADDTTRAIGFYGNFRGWIQYRKMIPGECRAIPDVERDRILATRPK